MKKRPTRAEKDSASNALRARVNEHWRVCIVKQRILACVSRRELATATGISLRQIGNFEMGYQAPKWFQLVAIAECLDCTIADLVERVYEEQEDLENMRRLARIHHAIRTEKSWLMRHRRDLRQRSALLIAEAQKHLGRLDPDLKHLVNKIVLNKKKKQK